MKFACTGSLDHVLPCENQSPQYDANCSGNKSWQSHKILDILSSASGEEEMKIKVMTAVE